MEAGCLLWLFPTHFLSEGGGPSVSHSFPCKAGRNETDGSEEGLQVALNPPRSKLRAALGAPRKGWNESLVEMAQTAEQDVGGLHHSD